jgi:cation transport protein ChaC
MTRMIALSDAPVALVSRPVAETPAPAGLRLLSDADFEQLCDRICAEVPDEGFWLFAYGSLMRKPGFEHVAAGVARLHGWRRAFCLNLVFWRATPEVPGLMPALAPGGSCRGVAYRLPDDDRRGRMMRLLRREFIAHEDVAWMRWLTLRMSDGSALRALTFYCAAAGDPDYVKLPFEAQVGRLARAVGPAGSGAEYLRNTVLGLQASGIHDTYLWRLQVAVAARIRADHGLE